MRIGYHPEPYWWNVLIGLFKPLERELKHLTKSQED